MYALTLDAASLIWSMVKLVGVGLVATVVDWVDTVPVEVVPILVVDVVWLVVTFVLVVEVVVFVLDPVLLLILVGAVVKLEFVFICVVVDVVLVKFCGWVLILLVLVGVFTVPISAAVALEIPDKDKLIINRTVNNNFFVILPPPFPIKKIGN